MSECPEHGECEPCRACASLDEANYEGLVAEPMGLCGNPAPGKAAGKLEACCKPPDHHGKCTFWQYAQVSPRKGAIWFYEADERRRVLRATFHADTKGSKPITAEEAQALWYVTNTIVRRNRRRRAAAGVDPDLAQPITAKNCAERGHPLTGSTCRCGENHL